MIRTIVSLVVACIFLVPVAAWAEAASPWVKIAVADIDTRSGGARTIDLTSARGSFRALRLQADKPVALSRVATRDITNASSKRNGVAARPGAPSESIYVASAGQFVDAVEIAWDADPLGGPIKLEVWGQQNPQEASATRPSWAGTGADEKQKNADAAAARRSEAAGPPLESASAKRDPSSDQQIAAMKKKAVAAPTQEAPPRAASRGITAAPPAPPPVATAPAPSPAPPPVAVESAKPSPAPQPAGATAAPPGAAANVCLDTNVCTIVDVFYGTDRKSVPSPIRISYGADRESSTTLGHAFVTVPKAQRTKGTIPRPTLLDVYLRGIPPEGDPAQHFTIPKNGVRVYASEAEFLEAAKKHIASAGDFKNHAFIYVHGYAVTFENAVYRAAQISYDLSPDGRPFGTAFVFSWPSAGKSDPFSYTYDQESADFAATHLREFIKLVSDKTGVENVHIIAHSMGNRVLIRALEQVALSGTKARINQIVLAAPDVDKQQFETVIGGVGQIAKGITLYASGSDAALKLSREIRGGAPRAGEVRPPGPALVKGVDTIDISALSTAVFSWGHDTYAESGELLADISRILRTGTHPPPARNRKFLALQQGTFQYWKYAN